MSCPLEDIITGVDTEIEKTADLLKSNNVVWHKSCKNKVDSQKVKRAKLKRLDTSVPSPKKHRRSSHGSTSGDYHSSGKSQAGGQLCIFCEKTGGKDMQKAATLGLDSNVRRCAELIGDKVLIGKISSGDLTAIDAMYHLHCLTKLYRQAESIEDGTDGLNDETKFSKSTGICRHR